MKILLVLIILSATYSFGQRKGRSRLSQEAIRAIQTCGLNLPDRGQRPTPEKRQEIKKCLQKAGIQPRGGRRKRGKRVEN